MGVTNFPDGVNIGSNAGATAVFQIGGSEIGVTAANLRTVVSHPSSAEVKVAAGTIIVGATGSTAFTVSGLTATFAVASPLGALSSTAGTVGGFVSCTTACSGGTITIRGYGHDGTISSTAGTAAYIAYGT